jgi:hypothetical protein
LGDRLGGIVEFEEFTYLAVSELVKIGLWCVKNLPVRLLRKAQLPKARTRSLWAKHSMINLLTQSIVQSFQPFQSFPAVQKGKICQSFQGGWRAG